MKVFSFLKREKWAVLSVLLTLICVFVGGGVLMADATVITPGSTPVSYTHLTLPTTERV